VIPLLLFEDESNVMLARIVEWTGDRPFVTASVVVGALAADVFLPVPNGLINTLAGSLLGWMLGSFVIWIGLTIGCAVGYAAGRFAALPLARGMLGEHDLNAAREVSRRLGASVLVVTRTVPMLAEVVTISAGITGYPFARFVAITGLANIGVAVVFAGIGSAASELQSSLLAFVGAVALPLIAWVGYRFIHRD
jgi:uncharacterized membrane protein YdjX (TVP38/TMEM64 family)